MDHIFYNGWAGLVRTVVVGVCAYIMLVVALRLSGKRTLSKMNAFDWIVSVALGSTLATVLLSKDIALAEGVLALALLIGLQFIITWLSVRVRWVRKLATGEPQMLLRRGIFITAALMRTRVTEDEVRAAVRSAGLADLDAVEAVVLETDGSFSVIRRSEASGTSSLTDVRSPPTARSAVDDQPDTTV